MRKTYVLVYGVTLAAAAGLIVAWSRDAGTGRTDEPVNVPRASPPKASDAARLSRAGLRAHKPILPLLHDIPLAPQVQAICTTADTLFGDAARARARVNLDSRGNPILDVALALSIKHVADFPYRSGISGRGGSGAEGQIDDADPHPQLLADLLTAIDALPDRSRQVIAETYARYANALVAEQEASDQAENSPELRNLMQQMQQAGENMRANEGDNAEFLAEIQSAYERMQSQTRAQPGQALRQALGDELYRLFFGRDLVAGGEVENTLETIKSDPVILSNTLSADDKMNYVFSTYGIPVAADFAADGRVYAYYRQIDAALTAAGLGPDETRRLRLKYFGVETLNRPLRRPSDTGRAAINPFRPAP